MTDLYTKVVSGFIFPLHEKLKKHATVAVRDGLEKTQWWGKDDLEQLRLARLRELLIQAQHHVPYYAKLFHEISFDPGKINSLVDLARLPLLTKSKIRAHLEQLKADNAQGLARFNTGGSSGEPLIFYIGNQRVSHDVAAKWRATRWWDVDIGDREIVLWGSPIELNAQGRVRSFRDKLLRTKLLPAFEMSEPKLDEFLQAIRSARPKMLFGYPSSLALLARHAQSKNIRVDNLGIKVAFVTSERLYDNQREQIESIFGCRVANGYGGRDAGFIAHECPAGGMHITAEDIIVEIVDEQGVPLPPGSPGEVVVTHLATGDFPFIRYRTGDVAILSDKACSCGRGLPLIQEIQGRTTDFIVASDGTLMHGLALIYVVRDLPGVQQFKIIQENLYATRILLVTDATFKDTLITTIKSDVMRRLGADVKVDVEIVTHIAKEASGKYRYVISHVSSPEIQNRIPTR